MTDQPQDSGSIAGNKGVKKGLPVNGLPTAEEAATKLWGVARLGRTSPEAFARQFGPKVKASGSTWDTRIALLRGFKLIETDVNQIGLSELGQQIVNTSNPEAQTAARRAAMMHLRAYRDLIESFDGTELPEIDVLASRLQFEYGKNEDVAKRAAQAFAESLIHAEMQDAAGVVHRAGMPGNPVPGAPSLEATQDEEEADAAEIDAAFAEADSEEDSLNETNAPLAAKTSPSDVDVSISVTVDLSSFSADDVVKILTALRGGGGDA